MLYTRQGDGGTTKTLNCDQCQGESLSQGLTFDLLVKNPDIAKKNMSFMRNNGLEKSLAKDQLLKK